MTQAGPDALHETGPGDASSSPLRLFVRWASALVLALLPLRPEGVVLGVPVAAVAGWTLLVALVAFVLTLWPSRTVERPGLSHALWVGGILVLLGPFAYANPWAGGKTAEWPWIHWIDRRQWGPRVDMLLQALVGLGALWAGLGRSRGRLASGLLVAGCLLLTARAYTPSSAFCAMGLGRTLFSALATGALGAGLFHLARPVDRARPAARGLVLAGVVGMLAFYGLWFPPDAEAAGRSALQMYADEVTVVVQGAVFGLEGDPDVRGQLFGHLLRRIVPVLCLATGMLLALVAALAARSPRSRLGRFSALLAWVLLLSAYLVPVRVGLWLDRDVYALNPLVKGSELMGDLLVRAGLPVWIVLSGAFSSLVGAPPRLVPLAASGGPARSGRWVWVFVAAAAVLFSTADFRPGGGNVLKAWPWQWEGLHGWNAFTAEILLIGLCSALAILAAVRRGSPGLGAILAALAVLSASQLTPVETGNRAMPFILHHDVEAWFPWALAAFCAGATVAAARTAGAGARVAAGVSAAMVLALLLYPLDTGSPTTVVPNPPYESALLHGAIRWFSTGGGVVGAVPWLPPGHVASDLLVAVVGVAGLAAAAGARGSLLRATSAVAFLAAAAYLPLRSAIPASLEGPQVAQQYWEGLLFFVRLVCTPFTLALFAASTDLLGRADPRPAPAAGGMMFGFRPIETGPPG